MGVETHDVRGVRAATDRFIPMRFIEEAGETGEAGEFVKISRFSRRPARP
jgi:hypothetical protein